MREFAKQFYKSEQWQKCRNAYKQNRMLIDGGLCEECHINQGYIVHHIIHLTEKNINDPQITLNANNLKYVCKECHDQYEGHGVVKKKKPMICSFDENGMPTGRANE